MIVTETEVAIAMDGASREVRVAMFNLMNAVSIVADGLPSPLCAEAIMRVAALIGLCCARPQCGAAVLKAGSTLLRQIAQQVDGNPPADRRLN